MVSLSCLSLEETNHSDIMRVLYTVTPNGKWIAGELAYTLDEVKSVLKTPLLRDNLACIAGVQMYSIWIEPDIVWNLKDRYQNIAVDNFDEAWERAISE